MDEGFENWGGEVVRLSTQFMFERPRDRFVKTLRTIDEIVEKYARQTTPLRRKLYVGIGIIFVICAIIGIWIPGWPTVSWMVPAAYLFSISDEKLFRWSLTNKMFGAKLSEYYANGKSLPKHAKQGIIALITLMSALSIYITDVSGDPGYGQVTIAVIWAMGIWWIARKVPTRDED